MHKELKILDVQKVDKNILRIKGKTDSEFESGYETNIEMYAETENVNSVYADLILINEASLVIDEHGATLHFKNNKSKVEIDSISFDRPLDYTITTYPYPCETPYWKDNIVYGDGTNTDTVYVQDEISLSKIPDTN